MSNLNVLLKILYNAKYFYVFKHLETKYILIMSFLKQNWMSAFHKITLNYKNVLYKMLKYFQNKKVKSSKRLILTQKLWI